MSDFESSDSSMGDGNDLAALKAGDDDPSSDSSMGDGNLRIFSLLCSIFPFRFLYGRW